MILHIQGMIHPLRSGRKGRTSCTTSPALTDSLAATPQGSLLPPGYASNYEREVKWRDGWFTTGRENKREWDR